ncbi:alpha/beta-Hydrolase [Glarea lozoyensis ATCC 20868]|uniref:Alpha/beta-Hydrolase n=1 Tax=Glarea lozoyensis (strain ATCC 20868 / MF5171) TaxID=1116229 RepID=S3D1T4_GLAL2|nr:alpha/beta-Hydrolase [Glarea lozoyensis ATCC 20868]EPE31760.1 alpha/beta-Hydrolase [Glarea lozoyensis ATCC 20868]
MSLDAFAKFPARLPKGLTFFKVAIPQNEIDDMIKLLKLSKLPPETYETSMESRQYGVTRDWMIDAKKKWESFDWRKTEDMINSFPNFTLDIADQSGPHQIHFAALISQKPDAVPVVLLHGWPGNFLEFLPMLNLLRKKYTPETLPYHVIVPSLPGYAFSSPPPLDRDFRIEDVARIFDKLMKDLGFGNGYLVQGGDVGSKVARVMAAEHDSCKGVHVNFCIMPEPKDVSGELTKPEQVGLKRTEEFMKLGSSYALQHATKPGTLSFVLTSNPLSLLAWIAEKFLAWTDEDPPLNTILESVTLYWLTETLPTSLYPYRQLYTPGNVGAHEDPKWHITKPFGFSWFPKELAPIPRSWAATTGDLVFYRQHDSGGHFAALERPSVLLQDIEEFVAQVWKA